MKLPKGFLKTIVSNHNYAARDTNTAHEMSAGITSAKTSFSEENLLLIGKPTLKLNKRKALNLSRSLRESQITTIETE